MTAALYTPAILRLAASIPNDARLVDPHGTADRRSPVCGSRIVSDVRIDAKGRIAELGQDVRACALGQASAALLGTHAVGRTASDISAARDDLAAFLAGTRTDPGDWPGLDVFAPARQHAARHAAVLLAFDAAAEAASLARLSCDLPRYAAA